MKSLSTVRKVTVQLLTQKACEILRADGYACDTTCIVWQHFLKTIYSVAKKSSQSTWKYNCEELVLNLTR